MGGAPEGLSLDCEHCPQIRSHTVTETSLLGRETNLRCGTGAPEDSAWHVGGPRAAASRKATLLALTTVSPLSHASSGSVSHRTETPTGLLPLTPLQGPRMVTHRVGAPCAVSQQVLRVHSLESDALVIHVGFPLTVCGTLGKSFDLSEPQLPPRCEDSMRHFHGAGDSARLVHDPCPSSTRHVLPLQGCLPAALTRRPGPAPGAQCPIRSPYLRQGRG